MSDMNPNKKEYIFTARWHWNLTDGPGPLLDFYWKLKRVNDSDAAHLEEFSVQKFFSEGFDLLKQKLHVLRESRLKYEIYSFICD